MCNGVSDEGIFDWVGFGYRKSESQIFCMLCCHQLDRLCTAHFYFALVFAFISQDNSVLKITFDVFCMELPCKLLHHSTFHPIFCVPHQSWTVTKYIYLNTALKYVFFIICTLLSIWGFCFVFCICFWKLMTTRQIHLPYRGFWTFPPLESASTPIPNVTNSY